MKLVFMCRRCTLIASLIIMQFLLLLSCRDDDTLGYEDLIIGKWKVYEVFVNNEKIIYPPDYTFDNIREFTSDGIFYIIQASDSIRFDYSVEGDKVYLSSDILFDTLRILKLDNEYLWTHRTENTYIRDTVYVNNEEFHYKRLSN